MPLAAGYVAILFEKRFPTELIVMEEGGLRAYIVKVCRDSTTHHFVFYILILDHESVSGARTLMA